LKSVEDGRPIFSASVDKVSKLGLGSSAAFVVAVVQAMVSLFSQSTKCDSQLTHAIAQISHYLAQNSSGSGYDVSAALFGSLVYRRPTEMISLNKNVTFQQQVSHYQVTLEIYILVFI
jgi:phosphomevalonate kinase